MKTTFLLGLAAASIAASPAIAGRTAIDERPDGTELKVVLGGYCDLTGEDCDRPVALNYKGTAYTATFADNSVVDNFFVHGNGLLTFGSAIDFSAPVDPESLDPFATFDDLIANKGIDPEITTYRKNLVSVGQYNVLDPQDFVFLQSSDYGIEANGTIFADFYVCRIPQSCREGLQRLTLVPTALGFRATIIGIQRGSDRGFVIGGVFQPGQNSFFIPAVLSGATFANVPEPTTWAMMIGGFGMIGAAARRRVRSSVTYA